MGIRGRRGGGAGSEGSPRGVRTTRKRRTTERRAKAVKSSSVQNRDGTLSGGRRLSCPMLMAEADANQIGEDMRLIDVSRHPLIPTYCPLGNMHSDHLSLSVICRRRPQLMSLGKHLVHCHENKGHCYAEFVVSSLTVGESKLDCSEELEIANQKPPLKAD